MKKKRSKANTVLEIVRDKNSLDLLPCVWKGTDGDLCSVPFFVMWLACASLPCGLSGVRLVTAFFSLCTLL